MSRLYFFLNRYLLFLLFISGNTSSGFLAATKNNTNEKSYLEAKIKELKRKPAAAFFGFAFSFWMPILVIITIYYYNNNNFLDIIKKTKYQWLLSNLTTALISCSIIFFTFYYYVGAFVIWIIIIAAFLKIIMEGAIDDYCILIFLIGIGGIGVLLQYVIPELIYRKWKNKIVVQ